MTETLQQYKDEMDEKEKEFKRLQQEGADPRRIALAAELYRLASDCYQMAKEDGLQ